MGEKIEATGSAFSIVTGKVRVTLSPSVSVTVTDPAPPENSVV